MRVTMLLADAAQEVNGKLYVLGGGWSVTGPDLPPMAIAIKLDVPWSEANTQHAFSLELVDQDGRPVPAGDSGGVRAEGTFEVGRPVGLPAGQRHRLRLRGVDPAVPAQPRPLRLAAVDRRRDPRGLAAAVPGAGPGVTGGVTLADVVGVLDALYDPRWAEDWDAVGLVTGRPRPAGTPGAARRRPGAGRDRRGRRLGSRPARHPPPAAAARRALRGRDAPQGPGGDRAGPRRRRAARRAHQRRRRRPRGLRRAGRCARAHRPAPLRAAAAGRARQARDVRPRGRRRARWSTRWPRPAPAGSATTSGCAFTSAGHRHVHAAARRRARRSARSGSREQVAETRIEMVLAARAGVPPWWRRCARRTPTRSRRSTCSSSCRLPGGRGLGPGRAAGRPAGRCASSPRTSRAVAAGDAGRGAGRRRPGPAGAHRRGVRRSRRRPVRRRAGGRRRRLRHRRPAAPPGVRGARARGARPGRRQPLGQRVALAGRLRAAAAAAGSATGRIRWRRGCPGSSPTRGPPAPPSRARSPR